MYVGSAVNLYSAPIATNFTVICEGASFIYNKIKLKSKAPA